MNLLCYSIDPMVSASVGCAVIGLVQTAFETILVTVVSTGAGCGFTQARVTPSSAWVTSPMSSLLQSNQPAC
jgi:hypothetical protein